jgi:predicted small lipoprotein YifL
MSNVMRIARVIFLWLVVVAAFAACGRKGPLVPPEALVPAPIGDLRVEQKGERFQVSWSPPSREEGGRPLRDLAGFRLFKRQVLPPGEDCEECPNTYLPMKDVDLEYLQDVRRVGDRLFVSDPGVIVGMTYQYKAVSLRKDGTPSRDSNKARRRKVSPPPVPRLTGVFSPSGVMLRWVEEVVPRDVRVIGFNVYRRRADALPSIMPLNAAPVPGPTLEDLRLERGITYGYTVRTVAEEEGETAESEPSNEVQGKLSEPE